MTGRQKMLKSVFIKMLLSFTTVLIAVTVLLSFLLYTNFERLGLRLLEGTNAKVIKQISYSANYMNETVKNFGISVFTDKQTAALMYEDKSDFNQLYYESNRLNDLVQSNLYVHSLYIYNKKLGRYVSTWQMPVFEGEPIADMDLPQIMKQASDYPKMKPIARKARIQQTASQLPPETNLYTYVLYDFPSPETVEGAVVVNVKVDYLRDIILSLSADLTISGGNTLIIDSNGVVMNDSNPNDSQFMKNIADRSYVQRVLASTDQNGSFKDTVNGDEVLVTYAASDELDWRFIHVIPFSTVLDQLDRMKLLTLLICISLLTVSLMIAFIVSRRLSDPIDKMVKDLHAEQRSLHTIRKQEYLRTLLENTAASDKKLASSFDMHGLKINLSMAYLLIGIRIDHHEAFKKQFSKQDQELLLYACSNAAQEILGEGLPHETVVMEDQTIVIVLNIPHESFENTKKGLLEKMSLLQSWSSKQLKLSLSTAFGHVSECYVDVHASYKELLNVLNYRFIFGHGSILYPEMLIGQSMESYKLSSVKEQALIDAMISGNYERTKSVFNDIVDELRTYSYDTVMSGLTYLTYSIGKMLQAFEGNSLSKLDVNMNVFVKTMYSEETLDPVIDQFLELFYQVSQFIEKGKSKRNTLLMNSIVHIIQSNYQDKSLCLESIANTVNMSKTYTGERFKEAFGQSVADYITEIRIQKSIELLNDNNHSNLSTILDQVGFENKNYFYKLFKKRMGVSFKEYKMKYLSNVLADDSHDDEEE